MFTEGHNMKITEKTFNVETGEETIIEREETSAEISEREKTEADYLATKTQAETKAAAKAALLAKMGLTADEAAILLS